MEILLDRETFFCLRSQNKKSVSLSFLSNSLLNLHHPSTEFYTYSKAAHLGHAAGSLVGQTSLTPLTDIEWVMCDTDFRSNSRGVILETRSTWCTSAHLEQSTGAVVRSTNVAGISIIHCNGEHEC